MVSIKDIELIIRDLIRTDELIVSNYDSKLLCDDFEGTKKTLKELFDKKQNLHESLRKSFNEFFKIKEIPFFKKLNSFTLMPSIISLEYKFSIPRTVNRYSKEYYCYVSLMDKLVREYDSISKSNGEYYILDISANFDLEKLFKDDE